MTYEYRNGSLYSGIVIFIDFATDTFDVCAPSTYYIGPTHEEQILGNTQKIPLASFSFSLLKVGIPLVKINICQRFKYL